MTVLRVRASEIRGQIGEILARIHYRGDHEVGGGEGKHTGRGMRIAGAQRPGAVWAWCVAGRARASAGGGARCGGDEGVAPSPPLSALRSTTA